MNRVKQFRELIDCDTRQLAEMLKVNPDIVEAWEAAESDPDYNVLLRWNDLFQIPPNYIMGCGIYRDWDDVKKYYNEVVEELEMMIPPTMTMPIFSGDKNLTAWLDTRLYRESDELQLIRWFAFAVEEIQILVLVDDEGRDIAPDIHIEFTPEFERLVWDAQKSGDRPTVQSFAQLYDQFAVRHKGRPAPGNKGGGGGGSGVIEEIIQTVRLLRPEQQELLLALVQTAVRNIRAKSL